MRFRNSVTGVVQENVGRGKAKTEYEVAESKPADVINRAADPATLKAYSDVIEDQMRKISVGLIWFLLTASITSAIGLLLYAQDVFVPGPDIILFSYLAAFGALGYIGVSQWQDREQSAFEKVIIPVVLSLVFFLLRALWRGSESEASVLILAFGLASLNPQGFPKLWAGIKTYRHKASYDAVLYENKKTVTVYDDAMDDEDDESDVKSVMSEPILVDIRQDGTPLFPPVNKEPFLVRQVEDFCYIAFKPITTERGPGSGLSRNNMLGKHIGPPNKTVPGRPQSSIKVSRNVYDSIMAGLYATGLVTDGPKGTAVWSKIKQGTLYESGYSIEEIRVALLRHSTKSLGKEK